MHQQILFIFLVLISRLVYANPCQPDTQVGDWCESPLIALHPTQSGVGKLQIEDEAKELRRLSNKKLAEKIRRKTIPVVIGPNGKLYLVDRHHFASALIRIGVTSASVQVIGRLPHPDEFWQQMQVRHWAWLHDEQGREVPASALPSTLLELPDYPYRSLAGLLQDDGYFGKEDAVYFVEFAWGSWLGAHMNWVPINRANLATQLEQARKLACSQNASHLPGYPGRSCH